MKSYVSQRHWYRCSIKITLKFKCKSNIYCLAYSFQSDHKSFCWLCYFQFILNIQTLQVTFEAINLLLTKTGLISFCRIWQLKLKPRIMKLRPLNDLYEKYFFLWSFTKPQSHAWFHLQLTLIILVSSRNLLKGEQHLNNSSKNVGILNLERTFKFIKKLKINQLSNLQNPFTGF